MEGSGTPPPCATSVPHPVPVPSLLAPGLAFEFRLQLFNPGFSFAQGQQDLGRWPTAACTGREHHRTPQSPSTGASSEERCPSHRQGAASAWRQAGVSHQLPNPMSPSTPLRLLGWSLLQNHGRGPRFAGHLHPPPLLAGGSAMALQEQGQEGMLPLFLSPTSMTKHRHAKTSGPPCSQLPGAETLLRYARSPSHEC